MKKNLYTTIIAMLLAAVSVFGVFFAFADTEAAEINDAPYIGVNSGGVVIYCPADYNKVIVYFGGSGTSEMNSKQRTIVARNIAEENPDAKILVTPRCSLTTGVYEEVKGENTLVYVVGFSAGGRGAFSLADTLAAESDNYRLLLIDPAFTAETSYKNIDGTHCCFLGGTAYLPYYNTKVALYFIMDGGMFYSKYNINRCHAGHGGWNLCFLEHPIEEMFLADLV